MSPEPLPEDLNPDEFWICSKHDRWCLSGYPCPRCQDDWRAANPERAREIERMVNAALPNHLRSRA